ncbi:MAG: hypothetical protein ACRBB2_05390 [Nitrosopumilus sp.]
MNEIILKKIEQKIQDTILNNDDTEELICFLSTIDNSKSFGLGIVVGRIYNSFYYQTKRIFNREPTNEEFEEFIEFIEKRKTTLESLW